MELRDGSSRLSPERGGVVPTSRSASNGRVTQKHPMAPVKVPLPRLGLRPQPRSVKGESLAELRTLWCAFLFFNSVFSN
jgi:hypothetical protein